MAETSKKQQEYFNKIKKALSSGDEQEFADLVRQKNPLAIRHDLSSTLGQHVIENYDEPLNVFKNKELLKDTPIEYTDLPKGVAGRYEKTAGNVYMPKVDPELANKQTGTLLHELGHKSDALEGFTGSEAFDPKVLKTLGSEAAEEAFGKHHKAGFFEKEALMNLLKNKKIAALAPLLKATGIGAAVYGMSQGDAFAADPTGLLQSDEVGAGSDIIPEEEMKERERFNKLKRAMEKK